MHRLPGQTLSHRKVCLKNEGSKEGQFLLGAPGSVALMFSAVDATLQLRPGAASSLYNLPLDKVQSRVRDVVVFSLVCSSMVVWDGPSSARGSAQANRGALCSTDGKIRLDVMNEVIHYHSVYVSR